MITCAIVKSTLPVAFSGLTSFVKNNSAINIVINCLPYKDHTLFSFANTNKDHETIKSELLSKYDLSNSNSLLKLIEVLSVNGTDNIFFDIGYWDRVDKNIAKKIIEDFSNFETTDPRNDLDYTFLEWDYNTKTSAIY